MQNALKLLQHHSLQDNSQCHLARHDVSIEDLDVNCLANIPPWLFNEAAGGIAVSGDSGTGKSSLLAAFALLLARQGMGFSLFDPAGDLYRLVKNICLDLGKSVRQRTYLISPAGMKELSFSIRPLYVDPANLTPDEYVGRLTRRVSIAARTLLHVFGDGVNFDQKPLLAKWCTQVLEAAAALGLSFVDAEVFLQVGTELYELLTQAIPNGFIRMEFRELATMRPTERENFIASTKNRMIGLLKSPQVRNFLSGRARNQPVQARSIAQLIRENAILLYDLSPHGKLRPEDQQIIANTALVEMADAVENFEEHERVPHMAIIDELPTFTASLDHICLLLRTCRKTKFRCVGSFQGTNFFPDRKDDRALHAFIGQCGSIFVFRHKDPEDAKFFSEVLKMPSMGDLLHTPKFILTQEVQYQDGNDLMILVDEGENTSVADGIGGGETNGTNHQRNWQDTQSTANSTTVSDTINRGTAHADVQNDSSSITNSETKDLLSNAVSKAEAKASGAVRGTSKTTTENSGQTTANATQKTHGSAEGGAVGDHHDVSKNWTKQQQNGSSKTYKQTLVPHLEWREVVASVQFYTPEEILLIGAGEVTQLDIGQAFLYPAGRRPTRVYVNLVKDPFRDSPKFAAKMEAAFLKELAQRPEYQSPEQIQADRNAFLQALSAEVQAIIQPPYDTNPLPLPDANDDPQPLLIGI